MKGRIFNLLSLALVFAIFLDLVRSGRNRTFYIDYENDTFRMDGKPFRYVSGTIHYFRVPHELWEDRLLKVRAAGFNTIQFVIPWDIHEKFPGQTSFEGQLDIQRFLNVAQQLDLYALVRPGPYIGAEHNGGGLPWWLYKLHPNITMRSSDANFLKHVSDWWDVLLPRLKNHLYTNGGNILMVQMENEYGSYGCDLDYTTFLRDEAIKHLGREVVLYTTDGNGIGYLKCGKIPEVYATIDFGVDSGTPDVAYHSQRLFEPHGPLINSEFYSGWLDYWGVPHQKQDANLTAFFLDMYLTPPGSNVNVYAVHGGTNFGFQSGTNYFSTFLVEPTSYDYDALITEAGDLTEKYFLVKRAIAKHIPVPAIQVNATVKKGIYGKVNMSLVADVFTVADILAANCLDAEYPATFGELNQENGFVLYEHRIVQFFRDPIILQVIDGVRDRGQVFLNREYVGTLSRQESVSMLSVANVQVNDTLHIFVENQGRIGYGRANRDFKGILAGGVNFSGTPLKKWKMKGLPLDNVNVLQQYANTVKGLKISNKISGHGSFWKGRFHVPCNAQDPGPLDTFLDPTGWSKGVLFINGFNIGRYWPIMGPQVTLYVPRTILKCGYNEVIIFELERLNCAKTMKCTVMFTNIPQIDAPTPLPYKDQPGQANIFKNAKSMDIGVGG